MSKPPTTYTVRLKGETKFQSFDRRRGEVNCRKWVRKNLPRTAGASISKEVIA